MPAHLRKHDNGQYYLIDGRVRQSLKTDIKRLAEARLTQYLNGSVQPKSQRHSKGVLRNMDRNEKSSVTEERFKRLLATLHALYLARIRFAFDWNSSRSSNYPLFQNKLLIHLAIKTTRNIIDGSFRSLWRSARKEGRVSQNPFEMLEWPPADHLMPEPFTVDEMAAILAWFK